jgi:hypothetical protein
MIYEQVYDLLYLYLSEKPLKTLLKEKRELRFYTLAYLMSRVRFRNHCTVMHMPPPARCTLSLYVCENLHFKFIWRQQTRKRRRSQRKMAKELVLKLA